MSVVLLVLGVIILVTAIDGTFAQLMKQFGQDVPGFLVWAGAIVLIGAIGYIPDFEGVSNALLALVMIVIVVVDQGAFANLQQILKSPPPPAQAPQFPSAADIAGFQAGPTLNVQLGAGGLTGGLH